MQTPISLPPQGRSHLRNLRRRLRTTALPLTRGAATRRRYGRAPQSPGQPRSPRRILIVGADPWRRSLAQELNEHFPGEYTLVGFIGENGSGATGDEQTLGDRNEIRDLIRRCRIDEVMIADFLVGSVGGVCLTPQSEGQSGPASAAEGEEEEQGSGLPLPPASVSAVVKRGFDIVLSLLMLMAGVLVLPMVALAIKLTSPGPVFYSQERVGRGERLFKIYKLRTMVSDAETGTGPTLARSGDPRRTPLGRFLRATKLDEWPQFYNVLRGDMSVVGPRPERPFFVQAYRRHIRDYSLRHTVRPGITGLAQIKGGYRTHVYVKLRYDLAYVAHSSLWVDLCILVRTPFCIMQTLKSGFMEMAPFHSAARRLRRSRVMQ